MTKLIPSENIAPLIHWIRNEKIILDRDLATLYGVETRALKQAVRRNAERFPADFMFELVDEEVDTMVSQNVIPNKGIFGGSAPMAFTEQRVNSLPWCSRPSNN
ncbi:MAG: ORF6N domain-containing protein [Kiritimatiellia bacterium]